VGCLGLAKGSSCKYIAFVPKEGRANKLNTKRKVKSFQPKESKRGTSWWGKGGALLGGSRSKKPKNMDAVEKKKNLVGDCAQLWEHVLNCERGKGNVRVGVACSESNVRGSQEMAAQM